jgi:hypothetical protein
MILITIASGQERQALEYMIRAAVELVGQRAWMVIWSSEKITATEALLLASMPS